MYGTGEARYQKSQTKGEKEDHVVIHVPKQKLSFLALFFFLFLAPWMMMMMMMVVMGEELSVVVSYRRGSFSCFDSSVFASVSLSCNGILLQHMEGCTMCALDVHVMCSIDGIIIVSSTTSTSYDVPTLDAHHPSTRRKPV
jgi:hypothetical protein